MANKRHTKWLKYLVALVILILALTLYVNKHIFNQENEATESVRQQTAYIRAPDSVNVYESPTPVTNNDSLEESETQYQVKLEYPAQHIFDASMCSVDKIHRLYETSFEEAIHRLSNQYRRNSYAINEYLTLNVYATSATDYFLEQLTQRIAHLHKEYFHMLGESTLREISLNLVIAPTREDYEEHLFFYHSEPITTLGTYFGGLNIAYVDYQGSDDKALRTAIHESVHAFNAHIIGKTAPMFNEGMAELYEKMAIDGDSFRVIYTRQQLAKEPYHLLDFFDHKQWPFLNTEHLYYSSWAWITFMQVEKSRRKALITFMKKEQADPCSFFSGNEAFQIFQDIDSMMELDFYNWQQSLNAEK
jgi:hypothetical protein